MYDPKFEKAVQRRMEELEFHPSESVWVNIEKAVMGRRRRRMIPFFWRLMVPAVLLTVAAGAYYFGERAGRKAGRSDAPVVKTEPVQSYPAGKNGQTGQQAAIVQVEKTGIGAIEKTGSGTLAKPIGHSRDGKKIAGPADEERSEATRPADFAQGAKTGQATGGEDRGSAPRYLPGLEDQRMSHAVSPAVLAGERGMVKLSALSRPRRPWEAGFVAGAGIDRLNRLDASQANNAVSGLAASFYSLNRTAASKNSISDVRPDASFYAGIYLQKPISDRWVLHLGLDLHYYSVRMSIGQQVNNFVPASGSLLAVPAIQTLNNAQVYMVGNEHSYTNRYYMLELPVAMQYKINRSRILPLFLEGGLSVSRLMGADALFYNPTSGLYLKSGNVLNKTQLDLSSSLLVGLPFRGIHIQAGPQVQYGLTPLINSQGLGDQHFFYTGIRLVVLPGRK